MKQIVIGNSNDVNCALCSREVESGNHLFFNCNISYQVWMAINSWTGAVGPLQNNEINITSCNLQVF